MKHSACNVEHLPTAHAQLPVLILLTHTTKRAIIQI